MNAAPNRKSHDPLVGYFASVALALLASGWLADMLAAPVATAITFFTFDAWQVNLTGALFLAIAFANPVGVIVARASLGGALMRFGLGAVFGFALQALILTPFAGDGMSRFLYLVLAVAAVPAVLMTRRLHQTLDERGIVPREALARSVLRLLSLPDRVQFIFLMSASFTIFWRYSMDPMRLLIVMGVVLTALTGWVALTARHKIGPQEGRQQDRAAWLALDPVLSEEPTVVDNAIAAIKTMLGTVLPGAILLGGVTRLAVDAMLRLYPNLGVTAGDPAATMRTFWVIASSGLGLIFLGMMAALGFSLALLFVIGRLRSWSARRFRSACWILVRLMYFRPTRRAPSG
ncbi:MAG: hypothetical protein ACC619_00040 [Paracoccaceae bacterium]